MIHARFVVKAKKYSKVTFEQMRHYRLLASTHQHQYRFDLSPPKADREGNKALLTPNMLNLYNN